MIKLLVGNSIELMHEYDDNEFDLCLTDPPYNVGVNYGTDVNDNMEYEEYLQFSKNWFIEAKRISKALAFTPGMSNLKMWLTEIEYPKDILCWYVKNSRSHNPISGGFLHWEPILLYGNVRIGKNAFNHNVEKKRYQARDSHYCGKPIKLYKDIINECFWGRGKMDRTVKSVIDPLVGSGTTAVVCKILGIDCVGIDINPEYIKEANDIVKRYRIIGKWL